MSQPQYVTLDIRATHEYIHDVVCDLTDRGFSVTVDTLDEGHYMLNACKGVVVDYPNELTDKIAALEAQVQRLQREKETRRTRPDVPANPYVDPIWVGTRPQDLTFHRL